MPCTRCKLERIRALFAEKDAKKAQEEVKKQEALKRSTEAEKAIVEPVIIEEENKENVEVETVVEEPVEQPKPKRSKKKAEKEEEITLE